MKLTNIVIPDNGKYTFNGVLPAEDCVAVISRPVKGVDAPDKIEALPGGKIRLQFNAQDARETCDIEIIPRKKKVKAVESKSLPVSTGKMSQAKKIAAIFFSGLLLVTASVFAYKKAAPESYQATKTAMASWFGNLKESPTGKVVGEAVAGTVTVVAESVGFAEPLDPIYESQWAKDWSQKHGKEFAHVYGLTGDHFIRYTPFSPVDFDKGEDLCESESGRIPKQKELNSIYSGDFKVLVKKYKGSVWTSTSKSWDKVIYLPFEEGKKAYLELKDIKRLEGDTLDALAVKYGKNAERKMGWDDDHYRKQLWSYVTAKNGLHPNVEVKDNLFILDEDNITQVVCVIDKKKVKGE